VYNSRSQNPLQVVATPLAATHFRRISSC
jgi:hypothetical protein